MSTCIQATGLNQQLQQAVNQDAASECRSLIGAKADPNARNEEGLTALQTAIINKAWLACKALIDNGAIPTPTDKRNIEVYLAAQEVRSADMDSFMSPCPNPYALEVLDPRTRTFQPLAEVAASLDLHTPKGIALFNYADETVGPAYGMIMGVFHSHSLVTERLAKFTEKLIILRSRVDDVRKLGFPPKAMRKYLPEHIPLTSCVVKGHANPKAMEVGPKSKLDLEDVATISEVAKDLGTQVAVSGSIIFEGCSFGATDSNVPRVVSSFLPQHLVFCSPHDIACTAYYLASPLPSFPVLFPVFTTFPTRYDLIEKLKAYKNNEERINATVDLDKNFAEDDSHPLKVQIIALMRAGTKPPEEVTEGKKD